jgi:hypothetical protein
MNKNILISREETINTYLILNTLCIGPGTEGMIVKVFSPKNSAKILAFFAQTTVASCKNSIITLFLVKNANFFADVKNHIKL